MYRLANPQIRAEDYRIALEKERLFQRDAYDRFRSAVPTCVFQYRADVIDDASRFESLTSGVGSTVTRDPEAGFHSVTVSSNGGRAVRQSRVCMPSCTGATRVTFVGVTPFVSLFAAANYRVRVGLFDDEADKSSGTISGDGYFAQFSSNAWSIVRRSSSAAGSQVDTVVAQSAWNNDRLDGTGPSGYTLSTTAGLTAVVIEESPSGVGGDRVGFVLDGVIVWAHTFIIGTAQRPVLSTRRLPIRYEIACIGTGGAASVLQLGCACFVDMRSPAVPISFTRTSVVRVFPAETPLVSIRAAASACRAGMDLTDVTIRSFPDNAPIIVRYLLNPTLTGSTFAATTSSPAFLVDTAATSVSAATTEYRNGQYGCSIAGVPDTICVVARTLTGGSFDVLVTVRWTEEF